MLCLSEFSDITVRGISDSLQFVT